MPNPTRPPRHGAKELYEAFADLYEGSPLRHPSLDRIIEATKIALVNPDGVQARALIQSIARLESARRVPIPDPELHK